MYLNNTANHENLDSFFFKNWTNQTKTYVLKIIPYFVSASNSKGMNPILPIPYFTSASYIYVYIN